MVGKIRGGVVDGVSKFEGGVGFVDFRRISSGNLPFFFIIAGARGARAGARGGQGWGQGGPGLGPGGARAGARGAMAPLAPPLATGLV